MTSSFSRFACQFSAVKSFKQLLTCFSSILQLLTFSFLLSVLRFLSCRYFAFALQSSCIIWFQDVTNTWLFGTTMCRTVVFIQVVGKFLRLQSNFSTIQTCSVSVSVFMLTAIAFDRYKGEFKVNLLINDFCSAICAPFSTLSSSKSRFLPIVLIIWGCSLLLSLPEAFTVTAVPFLNQKEYFPCVTEPILWDLTSCVLSWSNEIGFTVNILKGIVLYLLPLFCMIFLYKNIIQTLWKRKSEGQFIILSQKGY